MASQLATENAAARLGDVCKFFVHRRWNDVDGDHLSMRMRQRGTTTDAMVDHHLGVEVSGCGMGSRPLMQRQQDPEDLRVVETAE